MIWKTIAGAAGMALLLVGPAKAAQKARSLYEKAESVGSLQTEQG
jgi:hypothetical protein